MNLWSLAGGVALVGAMTFEALATTVAVSTGASPFTRWLGQALWGVARMLGRRPSSPLLVAAGPVILIAGVGAWIVGLWAGWWLIFSADPSAISDPHTNLPPDGWGRAYFAAYTLFSLGNGDFSPQGGGWQMATGLAVLNGLGLITLAITYLIPVTTAAAQHRQLAARISAMGETAQEIIVRAWNGQDLKILDLPLFELSAQLALNAQRHLAYPVLHYFHSEQRASALAPALAALDEATMIMQVAVEPDVAPHPAALHAVQVSARAVIDTASTTFASVAPDPPPAPDLGPLKQTGLPLRDPSFLQAELEARREHRRKLATYVHDTRWSWQEIEQHQ